MEPKEQEKHPVYLKHAHLKGYRTIRDLEVDFEPGLNIIIGKNGSGKTSLVEFLNMTLQPELEEITEGYASLSFNTEDNKTVIAQTSCETATLTSNFKGNFSRVTRNKTDIKVGYEDELESIPNTLSYSEILKEFGAEHEVTFIKFGLPHDYYFVSQPLKLSLGDNFRMRTGIGNILELLKTNLIHNLITELTYYLFNSKNLPFKESSLHSLKELQLEKLISFEHLNRFLNRFSPITEIRLSNKYNFYYNQSKNEIVLDNLFIEFKIDDSWLPYSELSDGTKRIFYLISEVTGITEEEKYNKVILLEEPELGIHPHQLHDLLTFLKEQSEDKQIILTTHSPQVLDILEKDELNRIKITYISENGTKVTGLNEQQKSEAIDFLENTGFLSDYWRYTDLEESL